MRFLILLSIGLLSLGSCKKDDETKCVAYGSDGTAMYEVIGTDVCNEQIDASNGEYCDCSGG